MRSSSAAILKEAYGKRGVAAFNVFTMEQVQGVFRGAASVQLPVLIQLTPAARKYAQPSMLSAMIAAAEELHPSAQFAVHLDHGDPDHCASAIVSGNYSSVMIDASHEPFEKNIAVTAEIVRRAHDRGISVEAELGVLSGVEDEMTVEAGHSRYTDPDQVEEFVRRTGCDYLAVAVGTSHGAYKMSGGRGLQLPILQEIQRRLPGYPLVLHGASNVPPGEVERINAAGGALAGSAKGVDENELRQAIRFGVTKVNVATDLRLLWTRIHREFFRDTPDLFDPVVPGKKYMEEIERFVAEKCRSLVIS